MNKDYIKIIAFRHGDEDSVLMKRYWFNIHEIGAIQDDERWEGGIFTVSGNVFYTDKGGIQIIKDALGIS